MFSCRPIAFTEYTVSSGRVWGLSAAGFAVALVLTGCAAPFQSLNDLAGIGNPIYDSGFSFSASYAEDTGRRLRGAVGAFSYPDFALDRLLAGKRQGDEISMLTVASPKKYQQNWPRLLPDGHYPPMHIMVLDSSNSGLGTAEFKRQYYESKRAIELDEGFAALHGLDVAVVREKCRMITDVNNDTLPTFYYFPDPKHEELYMQRLWSGLASTLASFRYAKSKEGTSLEKLRQDVGFDSPFVEELRGTDNEPNEALVWKHYTVLRWLPSSPYLDLRPTAWFTHYRCEPEALYEARQSFLLRYPEACEIAANFYAASHLPPEAALIEAQGQADGSEEGKEN